VGIDCGKNKLTSLKGVPEIINGSFCCSYNSLSNLEFGPKIIKGNFELEYNLISSIKNFPEQVEKNFTYRHFKEECADIFNAIKEHPQNQADSGWINMDYSVAKKIINTYEYSQKLNSTLEIKSTTPKVKI